MPNNRCQDRSSENALINTAVLSGRVEHEDAVTQLTILDEQYDGLLEHWTAQDTRLTVTLPQDEFIAKERIDSHTRSLQAEELEATRK